MAFFHRRGATAGTAAVVMLAGIAVAAPGSPPIGVYLWYPRQDTRPSDPDCQAFVDKVQPSVGKAQDFVWGRMPANSDPEFYLFVTATRMEPTYGAEGDYDYGRVAFGSTVDGETPFTLVPDDHPDTVIAGSFTAPADSLVVTVTLRDIPDGDRQADRVTHFCRFTDGAET